ncbi:hypothetical protein AVEN_195995-1 [Araneus ventricosus]|uniref:Uncharacterized protein n=1 Tax=Araneus ventricosus TaxID=182803 RepID=A0A4Y2DRB2_ARAVE|nr:hypothetical protein AVEN_195995-1 [Araneus ventricosus]
MKEDRYFAAFVTHSGHFQWKVLPFGMKNACSTFQQTMDKASAIGDPGSFRVKRTIARGLRNLTNTLYKLRFDDNYSEIQVSKISNLWKNLHYLASLRVKPKFTSL